MTFLYHGSIPEDSTVVWKLEGVTDMAAMYSFKLPAGHAVTTNSCGATEAPSGVNDWYAAKFAGKRVYVIHDRDTAGVFGSLGNPDTGRDGWATAIARYADEVRHVELPFPLAEKGGKDLRDWLLQVDDVKERFSDERFAELVQIAEASPLVEPLVNSHLPKPWSFRDDSEPDPKPAEKQPGAEPNATTAEPNWGTLHPERLAKRNLARYEHSHGGKIAYWREQWFRYRDGRYEPMTLDSFRTKVTVGLMAILRTSYDEEIERWASDPDSGREPELEEVTPYLVAKVIANTAALVRLPDSAEVGTWLPTRKKRWMIAAKNGIIDLDAIAAGKPQEEWLLEHTPDWFSTVRLDYSFDPAAPIPELWFKFLGQSIEDDIQRANLLQEWAGYLLTPDQRHQKFLAIEGDGANGKSVYFAGLQALIGPDNCSTITLQQFADKFELIETFGKAVNICADVEKLDDVPEGTIKDFVTGGRMTFQRKYKDGLQGPATAKLMLSWNTRPRIKDQTSGFWRRLIVVPFRRRVAEGERVLGMDSVKFWMDTGEMPGILNWAIAGLLRLQDHGFTDSDVVNQARDQYRLEQNPTLAFIREHLKLRDKEQLRDWLKKPDYEHPGIRIDQVYKVYRKWVEECGHRPVAATTLGREVQREFGYVDPASPLRHRRRILGERVHVYRLLEWAVEVPMSDF